MFREPTEGESDPSLPAYPRGALSLRRRETDKKPPCGGQLGYLLYPQRGFQPWHLWAACGWRSAVCGQCLGTAGPCLCGPSHGHFLGGVPDPRVAGLGPGHPEEGGAGAGRGQTLGLELDLSILATLGCILIALWYNYQFTTWPVSPPYSAFCPLGGPRACHMDSVNVCFMSE